MNSPLFLTLYAVAMVGLGWVLNDVFYNTIYPDVVMDDMDDLLNQLQNNNDEPHLTVDVSQENWRESIEEYYDGLKETIIAEIEKQIEEGKKEE